MRPDGRARREGTGGGVAAGPQHAAPSIAARLADLVQNMHAVVRKWKADPSKLDEAVRKIEEGFVPQARQVEGFSAYYTVRAENDEVFTISICQDREGIDETTRLSRAFVEREMKGIVRGPPEVLAGEVLIEAHAMGAQSASRGKPESTRRA